MEFKFEENQKVIYNGLIATIESRSTYANGRNYYALIADEDEELTCTASESECELYVSQEINQSEALNAANANSDILQRTVGNITDKHFRDGCH